jgi:hypothetical protein
MCVAPMALIFIFTKWFSIVIAMHNLILAASLFQFDKIISANKNQNIVTA